MAASLDLLFQHAPATSGDLVFGGTDAAPIEAVTVTAAVSLGGVSVSALVVQPVLVDAVVTLGGVSVSAAVVYDNRVTRWLDQRAAAEHQAAHSASHTAAGGWGITARERGGTDVLWGGAQRQQVQPSLPLQPAAPIGQQRSAAWQIATGLRQSASAPHQPGLGLRASANTPWQLGADRRAGAASPMQPGVFHHKARSGHWQPAAPRSRWWGGAMGASVHLSGRQWSAMPWGTGRHPQPGTSVLHPPVVPTDPCYLPSPHLLFDAPWTGDANLVFVCERHTQPGAGETIVVPVRSTCIVINNITLHRVDTGAELHAHSFSMSLDHQSWTWSWNASLHNDAAAHLGRDSAGDPAEVAVFVNSIEFRLRLETVSRDRRFSPTRWSVSGRGKASVLGSADAPKQSFRNTADRTAQQLMADVLTVNGVPMGWTVDWGLQDWLVPAGAWAIQGNYIEAINDIAGAAGGYVQPHATAATLRVLPHYPLAPWNWGSVTPDFEIPADAAEVEGTQFIDKPAYNRVFVGGISAGVFGPFTRAGTAGNIIAPQVNHALITHADAHRQRGIAELSDTGRQERITLNMQVLPETGVIVPGQFVRYLGDAPVMGIVRSTSIDWSRPRLRQTLEIEVHA